MVVVPWLACLPSTLTFRVRFPPKPTVYSVKFVFDKNRNEQKGAGVGLIEKKFLQTLELSFFIFFIQNMQRVAHASSCILYNVLVQCIL